MQQVFQPFTICVTKFEYYLLPTQSSQFFFFLPFLLYSSLEMETWNSIEYLLSHNQIMIFPQSGLAQQVSHLSSGLRPPKLRRPPNFNSPYNNPLKVQFFFFFSKAASNKVKKRNHECLKFLTFFSLFCGPHNKTFNSLSLFFPLYVSLS